MNLSSTKGFFLALAAALGLSLLAARFDRLPGDLRLMREVQALPGWLEPIAEGLRSVTATEVVVVLGLLLAGGCLLAREFRAAIVLGCLFLVLPFTQATIKDAVDRPRPDPALVEYRSTFTSESFPAGHVMSGTVLAVAAGAVAAERSRRRANDIRALVAAFCAAIGLANVYVGVHWPSDVLGGYLWAAVLLLAARWAWVSTGSGRRRRAR